MDHCARCGHTLGVGRYCVNCGQPRGESLDDWRTNTAERPAVPAEPSGPVEQLVTPAAVAPPPVYETPPQARYPMYADESAPPEPEPLSVFEASTEVGGSHVTEHRDRPLLPWLVAAVALLLVAGAGVFLLVGGSGDDEEATDPGPASGSSAADPTPSATSEPPSSEPPTSDLITPTTKPPGKPEDVASTATAVAPSTAPPSRDVDGNAVRYDGDNMLDGQDDTAWRTPGDASGATVGFTLAGPTRLRSVGLLNGYAKSEPGYDGYSANRRVLAVEWIFDDGTVVPQTLRQARSTQRIEVDVVTTTVQLRIVSVSAPGSGTSGRDFTAISTVALLGVPE